MNIITQLKQLQRQIEQDSEMPFDKTDHRLVKDVIAAVNGDSTTDGIFNRLNTMRQTRKMSQQDNALIWDIAKALGLSSEQAGILANDPTPEEIEQEHRERAAAMSPTPKIQRTWRDDPATDPQRGRLQRIRSAVQSLYLEAGDVAEIEAALANDGLTKGAASDIIGKHPHPEAVRCWECGCWVVPSQCPNGHWDDGMSFYCGC